MVRGHRGGMTGTPSTEGRGRGRGRGARGQPFQARARGNGRGRARGAGAASTASSTEEDHSAAESATSEHSSVRNRNVASPFAQLHKTTTTTSGGVGGQANKALLRGPTSGAGFGNVSLDPSIASAHRGQGGSTTKVTNGASRQVSVEGAPALSDYQKRYDKLKDDRATERRTAIKNGQMADPNQPTSLKKAITPVGTCVRMCPEFECVERIVQKMVDKSEKCFYPSTGMPQVVDTKMIKRFRRSAAGYDEQLPSDIRTPGTLLHTTNYLIRQVVGREPLAIIHKFVWDRTRSIRNDFSVQQVTHESDVKLAVTCLERIARFHIVSLHLLSDPENKEQFDPHQEREQLNNTMLSLMYYYDDNRERISFPNEIEFRAYYIIFSIQDQRPDLESRVQKWPASLLTSPQIQVALDLYAASTNTWSYQRTIDTHKPNAIAQGFYARFFNIIDSPSMSYLMGCVAEIYFNYVRQTAIRAIWKAYCRVPLSQQHKNDEWTMAELGRELHFDDEAQTIQFCQDQGLELAEKASGELYINWGTRPVDSVDWSPSSQHSFSQTYVESKRAGRSLVAVILGMTVREAARMGMIDKTALSERNETNVSDTDDDALFVSDKDNKIPAPVSGEIYLSLSDDSTSPKSNDRDVFGDPKQPPVGFHVINNQNKDEISRLLSDDSASTTPKDRVLANDEQPPFVFPSTTDQQLESPHQGAMPSAFGQPSQGLAQPSQNLGEPSSGFGQASLGFGQPSSGFGQTSQTQNSLSMFGGTTQNPFFPSPVPTQSKATEALAPGPSSSSPFEKITAPPPSTLAFPSIGQDEKSLVPAKDVTTEGQKPFFQPSNPFSMFPPSAPAWNKNDTENQKPFFQQSQPSLFPAPASTSINNATEEQTSLFQKSDSSSPFTLSTPTATNDVTEGQKPLFQQTQRSPFAPAAPTWNKNTEGQKTLFQPSNMSSMFPPSAPTSVSDSIEAPESLFQSSSSSTFPNSALTSTDNATEGQKTLFQQSKPSSIFTPGAPAWTKNDAQGEKSLFQPSDSSSLNLFAPTKSQETGTNETVSESQKTVFQPSSSSPFASTALTSTKKDAEVQKPLFQSFSSPFSPSVSTKSQESKSTEKTVEGQKTSTQQHQSSLFTPPVPLTGEELTPVEQNAEGLENSLQQSQSALSKSSALTKDREAAPSDKEPEGQLSLSQLGSSAVKTSKHDRSRSATVSMAESTRSSYNRPDQESEEQKQAAWIRMLTKANEKRDRKEKNRKRTREEVTQTESTREPDSKAPKVSEPEAPSSPGRRSARAFYDSLPLPPILERIRAGLAPKPPTKAELAEMEAASEAERLKRQSLVDQDQLLLNETRIVANQLGSGPSLVESLLQSDLWKQAHEPRRSSYGPSNYSPSTSYGHHSPSYGQSASPLQWPRHGYDVAHGPDLPPGVPLSRSEMRIRMTGAHGLANVPLKFSPEQKAKMRRQGFIFPEDREHAATQAQSPTPTQTQEKQQTQEKRKSKAKRKSMGQATTSKVKFSRSE